MTRRSLDFSKINAAALGAPGVKCIGHEYCLLNSTRAANHTGVAEHSCNSNHWRACKGVLCNRGRL